MQSRIVGRYIGCVSAAQSLERRFRRFVECLERKTGRVLRVRFNRNRWTYFSCTRERGRRAVRVNLHVSFLDAPAHVVHAVATLIQRDDPEARHVIRLFAKDQSVFWDKRSDRPPRKVRIRTRGEVYDLQAIFDQLNRRYFDNLCRAQITWGNGSKSARGQRHITFGTYDKTRRLIRVHPALDKRTVPEYFVRYIVFHEMLHAAVPVAASPSGRRLFHSRAFRQREREFEDLERAQKYGRHFVEEVI